MFHIYEGFHLVDAYHKVRHQRKYNPDTKRAIKIALVAVVTLLLWNMPAEWYGIQNLTVIQQRIIAIFAFATLMHHCIDALVLFRQWHPTDGERGGSW